MSVCLLQDWDATLLELWFTLSAASLVLLFVLSGVPFYFLYFRPTYNLWKYKINPAYPPPEKVKQEITVMLQGLLPSTFCPALSLYLVKKGWSQGYCGVEPNGYGWLFGTFLLLCFFCEFYEFFYHWCGHSFSVMWKTHKGHHAFFNPTPFAVVADNPIDQFFRAAPMLFFPLIVPANMDMVFTTFAILFYFNGLIQHSGHEIYFIDGHSQLFLTAYHHYLHHAKSTVYRPFYNGQFIQFWDHLFGSIYDGECVCSKCARQKGERSIEKWEKIPKPDYSVLLNPSYWWCTNSKKI